MAYKYSILFQMTTAPGEGSTAQPHTGGWSEGHWRQDLLGIAQGPLRDLMLARARMLPIQASIVGYRIAQYTITGNRLIPNGASAGKIILPGMSAFSTDVPQMALEFSAKSNAANSTRFTARCIPDDMVIGGEYFGSTAFKRSVTQFCNELSDNGWQMLGRDFNQAGYGIVSITTGGLLTMKPGAPFAAEVDSIRLRGVRDVDGTPVSGAFQLGTSPAANQWNLLDWPQGTVVDASGTARRDIITNYQLQTVVPTRIVVRKVGAPFERYRGKASRRRVA